MLIKFRHTIGIRETSYDKTRPRAGAFTRQFGPILYSKILFKTITTARNAHENGIWRRGETSHGYADVLGASLKKKKN